jgi:hypothetical protein
MFVTTSSFFNSIRPGRDPKSHDSSIDHFFFCTTSKGSFHEFYQSSARDVIARNSNEPRISRAAGASVK